MSHTVSVIGLLVFVGCADVQESQTPSAITAADDAYSGNSSDLLQPLPIVPLADAPIRSGYYESLGSYSFITIDVASPKDGSDTWLVNLYDHDSSNCNNPSQLWNLTIDGKATIECAESGRCWFNVDNGKYYAWSPTDPNEVTLIRPVAGDIDPEQATYVWVRDIDGSDTSCDCLPPAPPPPPPTSGPGYQGPPTVSNQFLDPVFSTFESPLVVSFSDSPLQFSGTPVGFDFYADGSRPLVDWILPPAGLIALDLDGNGTIDTGRELFGTSTMLLSNHKLASNGFAALAQYDANHDGQIDARDPIYAQLLVWTDRNSDGVSQPDELVDLAATGITSIPLQSNETSHEPVDQLGTYIGSWVTVDYHARRVCTRDSTTGFISDVWFAANAPAPMTGGTANRGPVGVDANGNLDAAIVQCFLRNGGAAAIGAPTNQVHAWTTGIAQAHVVLLDAYQDTGLAGGPTGGVAQDFSGGSLGGSICMHETGRGSAAMVRGWIRDAYFNGGGATSFLGYPAGDEYVDDNLPLPYNQIQQFDGGYIAWDSYQSKFAMFDRNGCDSAYCASVAMCHLKNGPTSCPY